VPPEDTEALGDVTRQSAHIPIQTLYTIDQSINQSVSQTFICSEITTQARTQGGGGTKTPP